MTHRGPMLAPRPPLVAYREDLARGGNRDAFGPSDATWLTVATILSHGVDVPADSRPSLLTTLRDVVSGDPALSSALGVPDTNAPAELELDAASPIVRAVVEHMEDAGALNLAYATLSILADADLRLSVLERGRVLAQLGRVAWKVGALETSREQYRRVEVLGRVSRDPELRVRAWIGYSVLAHLRGNYPDMRKWAARAAHEADAAGLAALGSLAYHNLMVAAAVAGDLNKALVHGWRAYQGAAGDPVREAEMLLNLSQFLLDCGQASAAAHGFTATLARRPLMRIVLPALGGLAIASSTLGDREGVYAARARARRLIPAARLPYQSAAVLLELSQALAAIGDPAGVAECRAAAAEIAERHGFHEISLRLEALCVAPERSGGEGPYMLDPRATEVARAVASLSLAGSGFHD
ncbi:MAG: hypothetical protein ABR499_17040 [Gemmatimonadaceae bacterium]